VLASDLFVRIVNARPQLAGSLLKDDRTKQLYRSKELACSLEEFNYDLSGHMGEALIRQTRLDNLITIKAVYGVLFESSGEVRAALDDSKLWGLYKARNIVVHRAGIVDGQFRRDTGSNLPVGAKITSADFDSVLILVGHTGVAIAKSASKCLE
jgi:hypothetical protein